VSRKSCGRGKKKLLPGDLRLGPSLSLSSSIYPSPSPSRLAGLVVFFFCVAFVFGLLVELFPFTLAHAFFKAQTANCFYPHTQAACHAPTPYPLAPPIAALSVIYL